MRLGCCTCMVAPVTDPIGIEALEAAAELGFDYVELSLSHMAALAPAAFADLLRRVNRAAIRCEACNNFFPTHVRLTGADAKLSVAVEYATGAIERAAQLGVRVIVFGSSGAKNVPEGFSRAVAWQQIVDLLQRLGPIAAQHGITIAIEPLNRQEANIVNTAAEGLELVRQVEHPGIQLLIDYYHFARENESLAILRDGGPAIRHLHIADVDGRAFPIEPRQEYTDFFQALRQINFAGRCSVEAFSEDFPGDARRALRVLRDTLARAGA